MGKFHEILFRPADIAFLVYFRLFAGGFIAGETINQLFTDDYLNYLTPAFHFTYQFFPWITVFPENGMYALFGVIIFSALCVSMGWQYRIFSVLLFLSYSTLFLMEKTEYVNHFYLYCTLAFWLMWMPAHRSFSIDVSKSPGKRLQAVPAWMYYLLLFQIGVVYFYAGIAKIHFDWLTARPMTLWMGIKADKPIVGPVLAHPATAWILSYIGLLFDLLIVPALLWRRSRIIAFALATIFHMSNVIIFGLATFPWFSLMMTALFFGPSWPRKLPILKRYLAPYSDEFFSGVSLNRRKRTTALLLMYAALQLLIPFRHFLYPYSPNWSEEGHRFSWHMMLRSKYPQTSFNVVADGERYAISGKEYLTQHQYFKMAGDPDMILEFTHFLRDTYLKKGYQEVEVYANALVSLNGRSLQPLIDPKVNLANEKRSLCHYSWILPFK